MLCTTSIILYSLKTILIGQSFFLNNWQHRDEASFLVRDFSWQVAGGPGTFASNAYKDLGAGYINLIIRLTSTPFPSTNRLNRRRRVIFCGSLYTAHGLWILWILPYHFPERSFGYEEHSLALIECASHQVFIKSTKYIKPQN